MRLEERNYFKMDTIYNKILSDIHHRISSEKILIIGIDGKGCSGKSYLSNLLHNGLKGKGIHNAQISIDDFCNDKKTRYRTDKYVEGHLVYYNNFNDEAFESILKAGATTSSISYRAYQLDVKSDVFTHLLEVNLEGGSVLIVEGLHLFKKKFVKYFDIKIVITITDEEQLKRALIRDIGRGNSIEMIKYKYKNRFIPSYELYLSEDKPFDEVDYIIDNNNTSTLFFTRCKL